MKLDLVKTLLITFVSLILFFMPVHKTAADMTVPLDIKAKLFLTALTYDIALTKKIAKQFSIGIVYFIGVSGSEDEAKAFLDVMLKYSDKKVSGLNYKPVLFPYLNNVDMIEKFDNEKIKVLYVSSGHIDTIEQITKITETKEVFTITDQPECVPGCGVSMRIGIRSNKPKIMLNLASAKSEGADFSSKFLRVVELVD